MIKTNRTMPAQSTLLGAPFGASAYGQTSHAGAALVPAAGVQVSTCVRVRLIGDMGIATAQDFPGTPAWRPPTC
jgi:hypothetical protein